MTQSLTLSRDQVAGAHHTGRVIPSALAVSARGLQRRYGSRIVIDALDLDIHKGEFVALLGESGCGKTTLLRALAGLDRPDAGTIHAPERPSVVFQEHRLLPWATLWENVALGHENTVGRTGAARALTEVGLAGREDDWPRNLSGGQAQRVALARALVRDPVLLLLDEPFAALDALTRIRMHGLVKELVALHRPGVLIVTHDVDEALTLADRILVMREGRIAASFRPKDHAPQTLRPTLLAELGVRIH
jgi:sulfonate transport system ATP-binding protein